VQANGMTSQPVPENIRKLERPDPALWTYYVCVSLLTGPGLLFFLPYYFFRYHTLRYRFDEEGIHMRVGILFRREVNLTYARIQDIHLRSGIIQRWLGLATVQVQTASGASGPEMVIEGFKEFEAIRDFLYTRMRGYRSKPAAGGVTQEGASIEEGAATVPVGELAVILREIRDELRMTREKIETTGLTPPRGEG